MTSPAAIHDQIINEVDTVLLGNEDIIEGLSISLLTQGHVLLEGVPGVAKTTIANLFARAAGIESTRIQMTPDLLPADITGTHIYREPTGEFELQKGPVFSNLVIADEINRATPKTQSALLEAMEERNVTIEGDTLPLPTPFMVVATQNPIEMEGTYQLPEAQRDRFQLKLTVELPDEETELALIDRFNSQPNLNPSQISQAITLEDLTAARSVVDQVHIAEEARHYLRDLIAATRTHGDIEHGGSPRATIALLKTSKARAAIHGRDYVIPDDIKQLVMPVLRHRIVLSSESELADQTPDSIIEEILNSVTPPGSDSDTELEAEDRTDTEIQSQMPQ
ncbi:AAA family ATPase [Haladaptatus pallidirubidus]|uniref:MoxR family ATPase n=1 Tax=Haladaptatus pallidirubidus TaxID=1008152 RepID=A0AAV3UHM5_9EURY|nr:MoxR family ATPase [Haladaptatus pallidirubidus]